MAKVRIEDGCVDIRVSMLERLMLSERSRRLPLSSIRAVNPRPPLLDMMMHWADHSGVWLCGISAYDGHLIPSARKPSHTLAIDLDEQDGDRLFVELDDEEPAAVAERIERARQSQLELEAQSSSAREQVLLAQASAGRSESGRDSLEEEEIGLRDPLMQGSLPPLPPPNLRDANDEPRALRIDSDRDLARLGGWLVALGSFSVLTGAIVVASGLLPGLLAVGAGLACGAIGGLALALVAHQQG